MRCGEFRNENIAGFKRGSAFFLGSVGGRWGVRS